MYGLVLLVATWIDRLQRRICRIVAPTIAASPESLGHHRHVARFSLFYRYYFGRCSSKLAELLPLS